jgi:hypothetical protein
VRREERRGLGFGEWRLRACALRAAISVVLIALTAVVVMATERIVGFGQVV